MLCTQHLKDLKDLKVLKVQTTSQIRIVGAKAKAILKPLNRAMLSCVVYWPWPGRKGHVLTQFCPSLCPW